jgi:aspartate carbamoyltransferase catalytic subunit
VDKRDFISIRDADPAMIESLLDLAEEMDDHLRSSRQVLADRILASLFLEPSTRTRLSFEAAMNRLGGRVLTLADAEASSISKGETLADSIRMASSYADLIVLRHPQAGAARVAAEYAGVPVINAGDGGHEHPTQTLCDLFALRRLKGSLAGLKVILYGDLKYGRTTHSLALALTRGGSDVLCLAEPGLELPHYVREACREASGVEALDVEISGAASWLGAECRPAVLMSATPASWGLRDRQLVDLDKLPLDALYVTRLQRERLSHKEQGMDAGLPVVDLDLLDRPCFARALVLHPLPRVQEIHPDVDHDARGAYFRQAAWGVPVRMALLAALAGEGGRAFGRTLRERRAAEQAFEGAGCQQRGCIGSSLQGRDRDLVWRRQDDRLACAYCDAPRSEDRT